MIRDFFEEICERNAPYIVAELSANHNGDMVVAKELVDAAYGAGADCIKFQSWSKETIWSKISYQENANLEEEAEQYSISEAQLKMMSSYANKLGIDCATTPFSKREVDFLVKELNPPFVKVASMDVNNYPFLEYIAKKNMVIVLSTGLSTLSEIAKAVETIENTKNRRLIILHCVAKYPTPDEDVNLNNIDTLQEIFPYPIGFSDHSLGTSIPLAATVKGVKLIEKHFTMDKSMLGWDHQFSIDPEELATISRESKRICNALGSDRIFCLEDEDIREKMRRSVVTKIKLSKGHKLEYKDLDVKRPGTGISPGEINLVIGRRLNRDTGPDEIVTWDDLI